jgi:hypothetical protein
VHLVDEEDRLALALLSLLDDALHARLEHAGRREGGGG